MNSHDPFFFWTIVPPVLEGKEEEVQALVAELDKLAPQLAEAEHADLPPEVMEQANDLMAGIEARSADKCKLAGAPLVGARKEFTKLAKESFEEDGYKEAGYTLAQYKALLKESPDCEKCRAAEQYGHEALDPCEITPFFVTEIVRDPDVVEKVQYEMEPEEMLELAEDLKLVIENKGFSETDDFSSHEYLEALVRFLTTWAQRGCRVEPTFLDALEEGHEHDESCGCCKDEE